MATRLFGRWTRYSLLVCTALILLCSTGAHNSVQAAGVPAPAIDQLVQQVLLNIRANGWNPYATTHNQVTGGLYINWEMTNPSNTNVGATPTSHDPQVDLYYLNALAEYHQLHPQDHSYDGDIQRASSQVTLDFANYNVPKGWIYFYLLHDGFLLHNSLLLAEAYLAAYNFYAHWYDPAVGLVYNGNHTTGGDYEVNHTLECGAALLDAGKRWNRADWAQAGQSTIDHTLAITISPRYFLFYKSMLVLPNGTQQVENYQAQPTTQGDAVNALVTVYNLTHNQYYLNIAGLILSEMFNGPLLDRINGGLFFALDMSTGALLQSYKETRGQTLSLLGLYHYNLALSQLGMQQQFLAMQQQLINLLTYNFYQPVYHGFFYRVTPTFGIYTSKPGQGYGYEDYFTTEAMGTAMDALQQTEVPYNYTGF